MGLIMSMLGIGGTYLWNTGKVLWNLPDTVDELKRQHTQDSIRAVEYINKIAKITADIEKMNRYLDEDFNDIKRIKKKLKIN